MPHGVCCCFLLRRGLLILFRLLHTSTTVPLLWLFSLEWYISGNGLQDALTRFQQHRRPYVRLPKPLSLSLLARGLPLRAASRHPPTLRSLRRPSHAPRATAEAWRSSRCHRHQGAPPHAKRATAAASIRSLRGPCVGSRCASSGKHVSVGRSERYTYCTDSSVMKNGRCGSGVLHAICKVQSRLRTGRLAGTRYLY